jgi:hypothetical protein
MNYFNNILAYRSECTRRQLKPRTGKYLKKKRLTTLRTYGYKTWVIRADRIEGLHENSITILRAVAAIRLRDKNTTYNRPEN